MQCWGRNNLGQLGNGTTYLRLSPVQVGSSFASVAAGAYWTMAVKPDGSLWAWGANWYGQVGDGTTIDRYAPVRIGTGATDATMAQLVYEGLERSIRKGDG